MIEKICIQIIENLGATGMLVVGLYLLLYRPLKDISVNIARLHLELADVLKCLEKLSWQE